MFEPGSSSSSQTGAMHSEHTVLQLTNSLKFQNTTIIPGSRYTPARRSREYGATNYFSGYVFRGDMRYPEIIFEEGFTLQASVRTMYHSMLQFLPKQHTPCAPMLSCVQQFKFLSMSFQCVRCFLSSQVSTSHMPTRLSLRQSVFQR